MMQVTRTFLPERKSLEKYIDRIYKSHWLTNFGELEQELTKQLINFLEVDNLLLVSNGTLAMQVLYKALGLSGEVLTTPFSFVATTSSLVWENLKPVFVDIDPISLNMNPDFIVDQITEKTSAILPVHVFGRVCDVFSINQIAKDHDLKIIYDAAHAFNVYINDVDKKSNILNYGDASILSFHATKLFHTIEGGAIVTTDKNLIKECKKLINFGITGYDQIEGIGINAKMNEFSAAMGLSMLENIEYIMEQRQKVFDAYVVRLPRKNMLECISSASSNNSYMPILLQTEEECLRTRDNLLKENINPRRYFYPSLDTLSYTSKQYCPISRDISKRILCLPMYDSLTIEQIDKICAVVVEVAS